MPHEHSELKKGVAPLGIALALLGGAFALLASIGLVLVIAHFVTPALPGHVGYELFDGLVLLVGFGACSAALFYKSRESMRPKNDPADAADNVLLQMAYASAAHAEEQDTGVMASADAAKNRRLRKWLAMFYFVALAMLLTIATVDHAIRASKNPTPQGLIMLTMYCFGCAWAIWSLWGTMRRWRSE